MHTLARRRPGARAGRSLVLGGAMASVALSGCFAPVGRLSSGPPATRPPAIVAVAGTGGTGTAAKGCARNLADELAVTGKARQLVTVNSPSYPSTTALLTTWRREGRCWARLHGPWVVFLGWAGISNHKREGDGTTPAGRFGFGPVMYGIARNPGVSYAYHRLVCGDWWDEDPSSAKYNTFQHVRCGTTPWWGGGDSEALWTETTAYQHLAFIEYNTHPVVAGRGSAIFLHDNTGGPTAGCVSLPASRLVSVLDWLRPSDRPEIVIGTDGEIRRF